MTIITIFYQIVCSNEVLVDEDSILVDENTCLSALKELICTSYERVELVDIEAIVRDELNIKFKTSDYRKSLRALHLNDHDAITIVLFTEWLEEYNNDTV